MIKNDKKTIKIKKVKKINEIEIINILIKKRLINETKLVFTLLFNILI